MRLSAKVRFERLGDKGRCVSGVNHCISRWSLASTKQFPSLAGDIPVA